jgi:hypothetical protein
MAWHRGNEPVLQQTVLNASRGWRFAAEGVWSSKDDAGAWAMARTLDPGTVEAALAARHGDRSATLDPARVEGFQGEALEAVERALGAEPAPPPGG